MTAEPQDTFDYIQLLSNSKELLEVVGIVGSFVISVAAFRKAGSVKKEQQFNEHFGDALRDSILKAQSLIEQIKTISMAASPSAMKKAASELLTDINEYHSSLDFICCKIDSYYKTSMKEASDSFIDIAYAALTTLKNPNNLSSDRIQNLLSNADDKLTIIKLQKPKLIKKFNPKKL